MLSKRETLLLQLGVGCGVVSMVLAILTFVVLALPRLRQRILGHASSNKAAADGNVCGAMDPVSDPAYNMREITKQSVLLEEHLVERNKYCKDCITKHFLHIIGLAEEAQMLACDQADKYPLLGGSADVYRGLFEQWLQAPADHAAAAVIAAQLREQRKRLIVVYFLQTSTSKA